MAYDEARHTTILFGGYGTVNGNAFVDQGSTWSWNGSLWTQVATTGPSPRHDASFVYDAARQRVVLYGGRSGVFPNETILTDTWEWNGTAWSKLADGGPPARVHQHMAYDRTRARTVLYGGFDIPTQMQLHDIWEWNGAAWTKASTSAPATTVAVGVAFDEATTSLLLFSLDNATNKVVVDTWSGSALSRSAISAPSCAPIAESAVSLGSRGLLWFGYCDVTAAEIHLTLSGGAWTTFNGSLPSTRATPALAYDRDRQRVVLFGGESLPSGIPLLGDTWEFDGTAWSKK